LKQIRPNTPKGQRLIDALIFVRELMGDAR
jgi:hypothetical protein